MGRAETGAIVATLGDFLKPTASTVAGTGGAGGEGVAEGCFPQLMVNGLAMALVGWADAVGSVGLTEVSPTLPNDMGVAGLEAVVVAAPNIGVVALGDAAAAAVASPKTGRPVDDGVLVAPRRSGNRSPGEAVAAGGTAAEAKGEPLIGVELKGSEAGAPNVGSVTGFSGAGGVATAAIAGAAAGGTAVAAPLIPNSAFSLTPEEISIFSVALTRDAAPSAEFIIWKAERTLSVDKIQRIGDAG